MKVQVSPLAEDLAAGGTDHLLLPLVPEQVLLEAVLRHQSALAYAAFVLRPEVPVPHVRLQRRKALVRMAADGADDGRLVVVHLVGVLPQVVLDLELLLADLAGVHVAAGVPPDDVILQRPLVLALVLADVAGVKQRPVDLLVVELQVFSQLEGLPAGLAGVFVLSHVRH